MTDRQTRDFDRFRTQLLDTKSQLEADIERYQTREQTLSGGPDEPGPGQHWEHSGYGDHMADEATELFEREKAIGMEQSLTEHLRQADHALSRIEAGNYGECERCAKPIPEERHVAMPEATLCIDCKAIEEQSPGQNVAPVTNQS